MAKTRLIKNDGSQAVLIPSELAHSNWDMELVIERQGDELVIRPAARRMGDVLGKLARFSADFMSEARDLNAEDERARFDQHYAPT
jgi:antitoxin VapB